MCVNELGPALCKDVQEPEEVRVEVSVGGRDARREGETDDSIVVSMTAPLVSHTVKFQGQLGSIAHLCPCAGEQLSSPGQVVASHPTVGTRRRPLFWSSSDRGHSYQ